MLRMEAASSQSQPVSHSLGKGSKYLLAHEKDALVSRTLSNVTHEGSSSIWLEAPSSVPNYGFTNVYRPMGDSEILYLVTNNALPNTQPYQAIIEGTPGREYAEKYLTGKKWVDTAPSTVVEFTCPSDLIKALFEKQHKAEDGAISMGLGHKAGGGLTLFNESIAAGETTWRVVKVKRLMQRSSALESGFADDNHSAQRNYSKNKHTNKR